MENRDNFTPDFDLEAFTRAYIVCSLRSSVDDNGEPLDAVFSADDIAPETLEKMRADCADFVEGMRADLMEYRTAMWCHKWSGEERAGYDFWLTRNGHGVGFWDRGLDALGQRLSDAAEVYGSVDLYVGDDGLIYS